MERSEKISAVLLGIVLSLILIAFSVFSRVPAGDSTFKGLYDQGGSYLVLFERDGEVSGVTFVSIDDAKYFIEGMR